MGYSSYALSSGLPPHQTGEEGISVGMSGQRDELGQPEAILSCRSVQLYKKLALIENKSKERLVKETEALELKEKWVCGNTLEKLLQIIIRRKQLHQRGRDRGGGGSGRPRTDVW